MNGLSLGLRYKEVVCFPVGLLADMIAVDIYKNNPDVRIKPTEEEAVDEFFEMLNYK